MKKLTRREFLKVGGLTLLATGVGGVLLKEWLNRSGAIALASATASSSGGHALVVVQLSGGNDGLNTVIPYTQGWYYDARPTIAIKQADVLPLTQDLGLHPNMQDLQRLYQAGHVAIIQGVGYPNPILSHFQSMAVWHTGDPTVHTQTGWIGRYLDITSTGKDNPLRAINIGTTTPLAMVSQHSDVPSVARPSTYRLAAERSHWWDPAFTSAARAMYAAQVNDMASYAREQGQKMFLGLQEVEQYAGKMKTASGYPATALGAQLQVVAELIGAGVPTQVFYTQMGGFDDHAGEESHHGTTLGDFSASVGAFIRDLENRGLADRATVLAFSEFGRRIRENGSGGTDHGEAGPVFLVGHRVKGGLYGESPTIRHTHDGDLAYAVDFRSVYATVLEAVLQVPAKDVLGANYERIACFT
ncbi:MAG: DUF1501 domain-containing protein [Alicyclobacillus macrosporangiidus]|uniref:DUF1501 domain-containing protein n=1 Tax=Alicyclobacillus macrosporangiidus TaxID=392015 RepID=UPI0026F32608|nr:DUF1501 domain-containing protein [Alicyclobacillus macrosporangiidus]MCL6601005.1 DUF1501 domain-containing protein [Alicyclobacillus macrosporangiidus]